MLHDVQYVSTGTEYSTDAAHREKHQVMKSVISDVSDCVSNSEQPESVVSKPPPEATMPVKSGVIVEQQTVIVLGR